MGAKTKWGLIKVEGSMSAFEAENVSQKLILINDINYDQISYFLIMIAQR